MNLTSSKVLKHKADDKVCGDIMVENIFDEWVCVITDQTAIFMSEMRVNITP